MQYNKLSEISEDDQIDQDGPLSPMQSSRSFDSSGSRRFTPRKLVGKCQSQLPSGSIALDAAVGVMVIINAIIIGIETDCGEGGFLALTVFKHLVLWFFVLEMCWRINQLGTQYFCRWGHLFDAFLVVSGLLDLYLFPFFNQPMGGAGALRLLRLCRILRILRVFRLFHMLEVIMLAFTKAFGAVMWIGVLVVVFDYMCAVVLTQMIGHHAHLWGDNEGLVRDWFGTIGCSFQTLFVVMTLSDWTDIERVLAHVIPEGVVFGAFMMYIIISSYTMVSLVTGVISESLITAQRLDEKIRLSELENERAELLPRIEKSLRQMDADNNGFLTREEAKQALQENRGLIDAFAALEIHLDSDGIDRVIDSIRNDAPLGTCEDEGVSIPVLAEALNCLHGPAQAVSIFELKHLMLSQQEQMAHLRLEGALLRQEVQTLTARFGRDPPPAAPVPSFPGG